MPETLTAPPPISTSAPTSTPAPATGTPLGSSAQDSQFDALLGNTPPTPAEPKPDPTPAPPAKPATPAPAKPAAVAPPAQPKAAEAKPGAKVEPPKPTGEGPKELRAELERVRLEAKTASEAKAQLESKIKEYEAKGKDTESLHAVLDQHKKDLEQARGELRALKREASPEFKKQYDEPFNLAAEYAENVVKTIPRADGTPADFQKDFVPIFQAAASNRGNAYRLARETFGEDAVSDIMSQVNELQRLDMVRRKAFDSEQKNWQERQKQEEGQKLQEAERDKANWAKVNEELGQSVEDYRDPVDDTELAAARAKGLELFDTQPRTKQEALVKGAHVRHRLGAFGAQQLTIQRLRQEVATLNERLAANQDNPPGDDIHKPGGAEVTAPAVDAWDINTVKREVEKR